MANTTVITAMVQGLVIARAEDGTERVLNVGDIVYPGEVIETSDPGAVLIELRDGTELTLGLDSRLVLDPEVYGFDTEAERSEQISSIEDVQRAIAAGADPTEVTQATAAGPDTGIGGADTEDDTQPAVIVQRIGEEVRPDSGFETGTFGDERIEFPDDLGVEEVEAVREPIPAFRINDVVVNEGAGTVTFTVSLSVPSTRQTTVDYATADGSAVGGGAVGAGDYDAVSGTLTFAPGATSQTITVPINNDAIYEGSEQFFVNLSNATGGAVIGDGQGVGTIVDDGSGPVPPGGTPDNDKPTVSISGPVDVNEAAGTVTYTVTLSNPSAHPVTVDVATSDGSATAGSDYTATSQSLTFAPGVTSQTVTVAILNDSPAVYEGSETYSVTLSNVVGADLGTASVTTVIHDDGTGATGTGPGGDDDRPTLSVSSPTVTEGTDTHAVFDLGLSNPSTTPITVSLGLSNGSADGTDYGPGLEYSTDGGMNWQLVSGDVTIPAGSTGIQVRTPITDDNLAEGNETFDLTATVTGGPAANPSATGTATILDNDALTFGNTVSDDDDVPFNTDADPTNDVEHVGLISNTLASGLSLSLQGNTALTSHGDAVSYNWDSATGTLTATAGATARTVSTITVDTTTGQYVFKQFDAIDHPAGNGQNDVVANFTANTLDANGNVIGSTNFDVTINDAVPQVSDIHQNLTGTQDIVTTNLIFTIDRSGSMTSTVTLPDGSTATRLQVEVDAIKQLLRAAEDSGNVNVLIVDFSNNVDTSGWLLDDINAAYDYLDSLVADGTTHYDDALNKVISEVTTNGIPTPTTGLVQNFAYFLSDGQPYPAGHGVDNTVTYNGLTATAAWESFLTDYGISESYAIGIGSAPVADLDDVAYSLSPTYDNGVTDEANTILLSDPNQLTNTLLQAFSQDSISGTISSTLGTSGSSGVVMGPDGGDLTSITIDGATYTYSAATGVVVPMGASGTSVDSDGDGIPETLRVTTGLGGNFELNFATGAYTYSITVTTTLLGQQEVFTLGATDGDGDTATLTLTLAIDFSAAVDANQDLVITNVNNGSPVVIPTVALLHNDATDASTQLQSVVSGSGGTVAGTNPVTFTPSTTLTLSSGDFSGGTPTLKNETGANNDSMATAIVFNRADFGADDVNWQGVNVGGPNTYSAGFSGSLTAGDQDWLKVSLAKGESIFFDIDNADLYTNVAVFDASGHRISMIEENTYWVSGGGLTGALWPSTVAITLCESMQMIRLRRVTTISS